MDTELLNYLFAWLSVFALLILVLKWPLRILLEHKKIPFLSSNKGKRKVRSTHIWLGVLLIGFAWIHAITSSQNIVSFNIGTITWIVIIFLALSYAFRVSVKKVIPWLQLHRYLTVLTIALLVWHIIDVGGIQVFNYLSETSTVNNSGGLENVVIGTTFGKDILLKDGTYQGSASSYRGMMTVEVTVSGGIVSKIEILSTSDTPRYYTRMESQLNNEIIQSQSIDIDTVSGATYSSKGYLNAIHDALSSALEKGTLPATK